MDATGAVTDTYDYDAFGNLISQTGTTPNNYLFAGEQFDPALGIYYNRARYYDQRNGRFWSADADEGDEDEPLSLHKYLYTNSNPVNRRDPSGNESLVEESEALSVSNILNAQNGLRVINLYNRVRNTFTALKPALAAAAAFYGLLNPTRDFAGVVYDLNLNAVTGGDYPDVKIGIEGRRNGDGSGALVFRLAVGATRLRLKFGDKNVSVSGGINVKLEEKNVVGGKLGMYLGIRGGSNFGPSPDPTLYAFLEFSYTFSIGIPDDTTSLFGQTLKGKPAGGLGISARTKALVIPLTQPFTNLLDHITLTDYGD
ncbi:MAG TPA: RHS repeat-associated core domain-containing protein [Candidatus Angelobacter sp.]|jgi:RHS repeat-associated protein|nr:RHS repeat-associated core domain-containing protein [Candidatus Angelobacter sp.]